MKHQNYTQNLEVDGPYVDERVSLVDCVLIFLTGVSVGLITALIATGN